MNGGSLMPQILKDDIRDKILKTALEEFMIKGYVNTTMKVIAGKTGIAVGNIYRYFKNKEELYDAFALPVYSSINNLFKTLPENYNIKGIEKKIQSFIEIYIKNKKVFIMLLENSRNTKFENMIKDIIINFSAAIKRWITVLIETEVSPEEEIFIKAFTTAYINGIISIISEPIDEEKKTLQLYAFLIFMKDGLSRKYKRKLK